ncbi:immunoglobulin kappa light chain-like isoform X2 [Ambystoma mexicanum]|uniref:immunoglobulin kappa light chain-like isoform X2 n=1 Tax=Ambystoma mexicanum TaxID=8296 RepID=UPI0037E8590C
MALLTVVACVLAAFLQGINGAIVATQTPDSLSMTLDERVQINCDLTLTTSGAPAEDHADFYCQVVNPLTFGSRNTLEKKHESSNNLFWRKRLTVYKRKRDESSNNLFWRKRLTVYKRKRGLNEDMVATQTPVSLSVTLGKEVKINCKVSSGSNYDSTVTSTRVLAEDHDYYCQVANPLIFGKGTTLEMKRKQDSVPSVSQFPPSNEEIGKGMVTLTCRLNGFYPEELNGNTKEDGTLDSTEAVENSLNMPEKESSAVSSSNQDRKIPELFTCHLSVESGDSQRHN